MMKISMKETIIALAAVVLLALVLLPVIFRARESVRRASCQNNLKQFGLILKMYANEAEGGKYPPLSPKPGNWMMDMAAIYPDYLADITTLICPDSPLSFPEEFTLRRSARHPGNTAGHPHPDCVTGKYYTYTGYVLTGDEPALALYLARHVNPAAFNDMRDLHLPIPQWENGNWTGGRSGIAVMWDRIPPERTAMPHRNNIINVLCMDGSVRAVTYSPLNHPENFPVTEMTALTYGRDIPVPHFDCY